MKVFATSFTIKDQIWTNHYEDVEEFGILHYSLLDNFPSIISVKSCRRARDHNFILCKARQNNVNSHNDFSHLIFFATGLDFSTNRNVQYLYDKFSGRLKNVCDRAYPFIEIMKKLLNIPKPYVTVETKKID